ncbi:hypothetical protein P4O66_018120 [Electrophorus voltai]|uniref:Uncharacterized protein n=1 Tax=Electrophorus voltai TaxID=2609070 RepID=A0AAD9DML4_9TELE|nr:hypothetical protein P4O66_018120 [Electrophorus voltai]
MLKFCRGNRCSTYKPPKTPGPQDPSVRQPPASQGPTGRAEARLKKIFKGPGIKSVPLRAALNGCVYDTELLVQPGVMGIRLTRTLRETMRNCLSKPKRSLLVCGSLTMLWYFPVMEVRQLSWPPHSLWNFDRLLMGVGASARLNPPAERARGMHAVGEVTELSLQAHHVYVSVGKPVLVPAAEARTLCAARLQRGGVLRKGVSFTWAKRQEQKSLPMSGTALCALPTEGSQAQILQAICNSILTFGKILQFQVRVGKLAPACSEVSGV